MAKKNTADVLINGKVYTISGYESTAYLQKVATYLNEMEEKVAVTEGYARLTADEKQLLKNMNLADVYFKADAARESLEKEKEQKDRELYSLKHDLIDAKLEQEKLKLDQDLAAAQDTNQWQQRSAEAMDWFWQVDEAYVRGKYSLCRTLMRHLEDTGDGDPLKNYLPQESATKNGRFSPYHRYEEIYNALH